jgi:hypothetical protein
VILRSREAIIFIYENRLFEDGNTASLNKWIGLS